MLLIDDLLLTPLQGVIWLAEKVREAAQEEMAGEADRVTDELRQLYLALEAKQIDEADFDARERVLLDRLDAIHARRASSEQLENVPAEDQPPRAEQRRRRAAARHEQGR